MSLNCHYKQRGKNKRGPDCELDVEENFKPLEARMVGGAYNRVKQLQIM